MTRPAVPLLLCGLLMSLATPAWAEPLRMHDAVTRAVSRYRSLAVKRHELNAAEARATGVRDAYLPDVTAAAQQSFGTVNGAFGPQTPIGLQGISSAGPTSSDQSWNAAFGANYLLAVNWELFTFGRVDARIDLADASARRAKADLEQERFVHGVRVAGTYLDLLVAQQLARVATSNLERASSVQNAVAARARPGRGQRPRCAGGLEPPRHARSEHRTRGRAARRERILVERVEEDPPLLRHGGGVLAVLEVELLDETLIDAEVVMHFCLVAFLCPKRGLGQRGVLDT